MRGWPPPDKTKSRPVSDRCFKAFTIFRSMIRRHSARFQKRMISPPSCLRRCRRRGVNPADPEFIEALQTFCKDKQALLIADEIQTGIGRTGKAFGYEHFGISGHYHCCERAWKRFSRRSRDRQKKLGDAFTPGTHGTTFGGNKLAMAAVKATLDIVFQPDFLQAAADKGSFKSAAEP